VKERSRHGVNRWLLRLWSPDERGHNPLRAWLERLSEPVKAIFQVAPEVICHWAPLPSTIVLIVSKMMSK
jgi:hypothetical protein